MKKIQVIIFIGFLGVGKMILFNVLLYQLKGQNNVVIENEFGQVFIDGGLVWQYFSDVYEISNGCICCLFDDELFDVFIEFVYEDLVFDYFFIEVMGVVDSGSLVGVFLCWDISQCYELVQVIGVVDVINVVQCFEEVEEVSC